MELIIGRSSHTFDEHSTDCISDGKKVSIEGMPLPRNVDGTGITIATAGSALIQACEKAGVTIPR